jgi:uncharacterized repeat protein (TIGR03803 family)
MKNHCLLSALMAALSLIPTGRAPAQTFTTLYSFTNASDGEGPGELILSGNTLYGTTGSGGPSSSGTIFEVNTDGSGFATLYSFTAIDNENSPPYSFNSDGADPNRSLVLSGNTLYGTASHGGAWGCGTVFQLNTNGTGFATIFSFTYADSDEGAQTPFAGVILSGNTLYGTTSAGGGGGGNGCVFSVDTNGNFADLHGFTGGSGGDLPVAGLIVSGNTLYGTTADGGAANSGTVFKVNTHGTGFATLHKFTALTGTSGLGGAGINSDGADPNRSLVLSGNTLYGTAYGGGASGNGTVFQVNTDGTGFATLHSFTGANGDGAGPEAGLILSGNTLYGTTVFGGAGGLGTVFQVNTDGTGFATLYSFTGCSYGVNPFAGVILSGNTLYGTASSVCSGYGGVVFSLSLPFPQLSIIRSETNVVLSWPANFPGFTLQSTTNIDSPATWTPVSTTPVVVNGQDTVTNAICGTQQFYSLQK